MHQASNAQAIPLDQCTVRPGDTYVNMKDVCMVLAVYADNWQSRVMFPPYVDKCLVLVHGPRTVTLGAVHVQRLVETQRKMDRGEDFRALIHDLV